MPVAAGHEVRASYVWEDDGSGNPDFATSSPDDTDDKPFGSDPTFDSMEGSNQAVRVFDPNDRKAREAIEQMFDGSWSITFNLTNPWFIRAVIDNNVSTSGSSAPYTHTIDGDVPYPMRITVGNEETGNERTLKGCVVASCSIEQSVGEIAQITLDGAYADEDVDTPASLKAQPAVNERPLHFAQASLARDGSTLSLIQSASLDIENNIDLIGELGSRVNVAYSPKVMNIDLTYGDIVEDDTELKRQYGGSSATSPQTTVENSVSAKLSWDNGKSGGDKNALDLILSGVTPDGYSRSGQGDPEADLEGELSEIPLDVKAEADIDNASPR